MNATFFKRGICSLIDIVFTYMSIPVILYLRPNPQLNIFRYVFLVSLLLQIIIYWGSGQTIGGLFMGLKVVSTSRYTYTSGPSKFKFFIRALMKSFVFVPWVMEWISVVTAMMMIVFSLLLQLHPAVKGKKMLIWDMCLQMAVIEGGHKPDRIFSFSGRNHK